MITLNYLSSFHFYLQMNKTTSTLLRCVPGLLIAGNHMKNTRNNYAGFLNKQFSEGESNLCSKKVAKIQHSRMICHYMSAGNVTKLIALACCEPFNLLKLVFN